jgi:hypothetical protein
VTRAVLLAATLATAAGGCAPRIPGDGRLVLVAFEPGVEARQVDTAELGPVTFGEAIDAGAQYWDVVGARVRTRYDLTAAERAVAEDEAAATLTFRCATDTQRSLEDLLYRIDAFAWYNESDGEIYVDCGGPDRGYEWTWLTAAFAHEIGHAMGLDHVSGHAIMNAAGSDYSAIQTADKAEFCRTAIHNAEVCSARS